jgi:hypothetical protein
MSDLDDKFSVDIAVQWFDIFLAALDCYVWVFGEKLLTPAELFKNIESDENQLVQLESTCISSWL